MNTACQARTVLVCRWLFALMMLLDEAVSMRLRAVPVAFLKFALIQ